MVKITGKEDYSRFARPTSDDEGICRMRWTVEDQSLEAEAGDVIVTPAGTAHGYEVLGDEPARVVCIDSPTRPRP